MNLYGMNIVSSEMALTTKCIVAKHPTPKRRRKWRVVRVTVPACFQMGETFVMHPTLVAKLKEHAA